MFFGKSNVHPRQSCCRPLLTPPGVTVMQAANCQRYSLESFSFPHDQLVKHDEWQAFGGNVVIEGN